VLPAANSNGWIRGHLITQVSNTDRPICLEKGWVGKRKIRIYLLWRKCYHSFCWVQLLKDGSFSFGFQSRKLRFTEWGTAVVRSGYFTEHIQTLAGGSVNIKDVSFPHVTFHSPAIQQKSGIVHLVGSNGIVDEWELDWFPVKTAQALLYAYTGDIAILEKATRLSERHEIAVIPSSMQCLRMELIIHPRSATLKQIHDQSAIANIHGFCPNYIVSLCFYENPLAEPCLDMATNSYLPKS
jgi:hypothetical protein